MPVLLYQTKTGPIVQIDGQYFKIAPSDWNLLLNMDGLLKHLRQQAKNADALPAPGILSAPIGGQEIWAAGVTYYRSRTARIEESRDAGGGDFYDRVYEASRPELFFKATPHRVSPPGGVLSIRRDSQWMVPEPELTLVINNKRDIIGYTVGNDLSCRDIEGENPLYLPQAKVFDGCAAIGPGLLIRDEPLPPATRIELEILRDGEAAFKGETALSEMKRKPEELVEYLTREASFPVGCYLMTGTGVVPDDDFSLAPGDEVRITIEPIGTLINTMA